MKPMTDPMSAPAWPPTTFAIPQLWERVKAMFAVLMREVRSTSALAQTWKLARVPRRDILCRLVPLEKIVRAVLVTEAITFLLASWACRFRIVGWNMPEPDAPPPPPPTPRRSWISTLDDDTAYPRVRNPDPWKKPKLEPDPSPNPSVQTLARRIEALTRVIANPLPAIRRLAKFLARLPRNAIAEPSASRIDSRWWWHGRPEYFNACTLCIPAVSVFNRREEPG